MKNPLFFILCTALFLSFFSCEKKCGCDQSTEKTLHAHKALLNEFFQGTGFPVMSIDSNYYEVCNPEIIPQALFDEAFSDSTHQAKIIIDGELKPSCVKGQNVFGPYVHLSKIVKDTLK